MSTGPETTLADLTVSGSVATVTLNRPERHNSLIPALLTDLIGVLDAAQRDPETRVIILAANGRSFSTGGDVAAFHARGDDLAEYAGETVGLLNTAMLSMVASSKPIVCAVHGMVTGGSMGLVLASDIVLVAPQVTFTPWYPVVGFSPDGGWTALLPRIIGRQRAAAVLVENRSITAEEAVAWGIADRVVDGSALRAEARATAERIAGHKPGSLASTRRLLGELDDVGAALERERRAFVAQVVTDEARRGMAAFLESA